jgi:hypothetical protein
MGTPAPWGPALLAAAALLVPGPITALSELEVLHTSWPVLAFGAYLFILAGVLVGWVKAFPRWSYPYIGYGVIYALYLSGVSTPAVQILGYTFPPNQLWG